MRLDKRAKQQIELYFDMGTGYVLHYSNNSFAELFERFEIDIYDDKYADIGTSKAKRLRSFFEKHDDALISRVLLEMIEDYDIERASNHFGNQKHNETLRQKCIDIANQLALSPVPANNQFKAPPIQPSQMPTQPAQRSGGWNTVNSSQPKMKPKSTPTPQPTSSFMNKTQPQQTFIPTKEKVFIVHGHDELLLTATENLCRKLNLEPIILKNQSSGGNTIIEKLIANSNVRYAVILYTECDEGRKMGDPDLRPRARQNVVFEHGYFIGKLGRPNVAAVVKGNVDIQGDIDGVVYIQHQAGWEFQLAREMQGAGLSVDLNHV